MSNHPVNSGIGSDYYQMLHDTNPAFQNNNWLLEDVPLLKLLGGNSILEVGCGNGRFLREASSIWKSVVGLDWARSPLIESIQSECSNVEFIQSDVTRLSGARIFDLVVSADFLEHLMPELLPAAVAKLTSIGKINYHKIACYDDGHSHLSIFPPDWWLRLFNENAPRPEYCLHSIKPRKGDPNKLVVVLTNAMQLEQASAR